MSDGETKPHLFSALKLRGITLKNRVVVSPMQQYSAASDGKATRWHSDHLGRLSFGGAALVFTEALAVSPEGRITYADLGIWNDDQGEMLQRIASEIGRNGAVPGAQLAHSGRKGALRKPWDGFAALKAVDAARGEPPWDMVGPTAHSVGVGRRSPTALDKFGISRIIGHFAAAARRAALFGFKVLEVHAAHGYLIHSFLSPLTNNREDEYGRNFHGRIRFALEVVAAIRSEWPEKLPLIFRISCVDEMAGGWVLPDTITLARMLLSAGVDVIDCSSGGLVHSSMDGVNRSEGHRMSLTAEIRKETPIRTILVGGIRSAQVADQAVRSGATDLVAVGRQMLWDPFWALHAAYELSHDSPFEIWPLQYRWWLDRRRETDQVAAKPQSI